MVSCGIGATYSNREMNERETQDPKDKTQIEYDSPQVDLGNMPFCSKYSFEALKTPRCSQSFHRVNT